MEILVILSLFVSLAILAPLFGHDSRESLSSHEERLAAHGLTWGS